VDLLGLDRKGGVSSSLLSVPEQRRWKGGAAGLGRRPRLAGGEGRWRERLEEAVGAPFCPIPWSFG